HVLVRVVRAIDVPVRLMRHESNEPRSAAAAASVSSSSNQATPGTAPPGYDCNQLVSPPLRHLLWILFAEYFRAFNIKDTAIVRPFVEISFQRHVRCRRCCLFA